MMKEYGLDIEEIKKALEDQSGYPFELEMVRRVDSCGYLVSPNYSFEDQDTGQSRELDFHALSVNVVSGRKEEFVWTVVLGSCKDNKDPYVFFTRDTTSSGITLQSDLPIAGCPLTIYKQDDEVALEWYLKLHEFLHIATTDIVSSQFCQLVRKKGSWQVQSAPIFENTLIPLIKAVSKEIEFYNAACVPKKDEEPLNYQIYYPLLVIKGPMFEYYVPSKGATELKEPKHILIIRHYESRTVRGEYAIDVIHESYLEQYLQLVKREVNQFVRRIRRHKKTIIESISRIAQIEAEKTKPQLI